MASSGPDMWGNDGGDAVSQGSNHQTINPANLSPSTDKACMKGSSFIGEYLFELWKNQCLCDVRLQVGDKSFLAHKIVLAAFSDVFCPSQPQIKPTVCFNVPGTTPDAIYQILLYLYTSEMHLTDCNLEPVLVAACFMGITDIVDMIRAILDRPTVENLQHYMDIRQRQGMKHSILDFPRLIKEHFADLIEDPVFLCITFEELETLLMNPNLMVNSEMDTVRAVISWLEFNPLNRTQHTARLLELVNLEAVDTEELVRLKSEKQHLFENPIASEIIMDAFIKRAKACGGKDDDMTLNNPTAPRFPYGDLSMNKACSQPGYILTESSAQEPYGLMTVKNENMPTSITDNHTNRSSRIPRSKYTDTENSQISRKRSPYFGDASVTNGQASHSSRVPRSTYIEPYIDPECSYLSRKRSPSANTAVTNGRTNPLSRVPRSTYIDTEKRQISGKRSPFADESIANRQNNQMSRVPRSRYIETEERQVSRKKSPYADRNLNKSTRRKSPAAVNLEKPKDTEEHNI